MKKLLLSAAVISLMIACEQKPDNVSSDATGSDSSAVASASSKEEKEERNKAIALESVNDVSNHNVDSGLKHVATETLDYGDGSMPAIKNKDSIIAGIKGFIAAFPDYKGENLVAVADDDKVLVYGDWSGTFKNDFMGMKATGKSFKVKDVDIFTFNDKGEIVEHRSIVAWTYIMSQAGVPPQKK
ncbi:MAG: ester cyclase [Flavitalea sp.]